MSRKTPPQAPKPQPGHSVGSILPADSQGELQPSPPRLNALATALPRHTVTQPQARRFARSVFGNAFPERLYEVFEHSGIDRRHLVLPLSKLGKLTGLARRNAAYVEEALALSERAIRACLRKAGLKPKDIDHILFVSSTGFATPSLDAHLLNRLGFRKDTRRTPIWGLGCAGGAGGLARAAEFAKAEPRSRILLVCVELCSVTFQPGDRSKSNLVATALFGDAAVAAVLSCLGSGPVILASRSVTWPDTLDIMGWEVNDQGLKVLFSRSIPALVRAKAAPEFRAFLSRQGKTLASLRHLIVHPGGPKVLSAYAEALGIPESRLAHGREVFRRCGNISSATVLFVLDRFLKDPAVRKGDLGLLTAPGPGFSSEMLLLRF